MFDLGIQELIIIFVVALLVLGPKKLPELGRTLGKAMAELKRAMHGIKEQMDSEINDIKEPIKKDYLAFKDDILEKDGNLSEEETEKTISEKKGEKGD